MAIAYIALGSNIGDRERNLRTAVDRLCDLGHVQQVSPFIDTAPVGVIDQPRFLNSVAELVTYLPPLELLSRLLEIEVSAGRTRGERWGPRTLDLDILLYDELVIDLDRLHIPHPRMHERRFVLEPLAAIKGDIPHPLFKKTAQELLEALIERTA